MVQTDKITGQMVMTEDGTIISSSGELSSNEAIAQHIISLISQTFPLAFKVPGPPSSTASSATGASSKQSGSAAPVNGSVPTDTSGACTSPKPKRIVRPFPWKSVTVDYGSHCYVICLSNRKIHVVKREKTQTD